MEQDFRAVASWIEGSDPDGEPSFNPPASEAQITDAERRLGSELPPAARELYRLTDGQPSCAVALEGSFILLSLKGVVEATRFLNEEFPDGINVHDPDHEPMDVDAGVRPTWWSRNWVPVMENGGGDYLCLDLDPADGGTRGQIVAYYHDETFRRVVAAGMDTLLARLAGRLASGRCRIADGMIQEPNAA